jgi:hypothetical protein
MTPKEIRPVVQQHYAWLSEAADGVQANLSGANLRGADLTLTDLRWANLPEADLRDADLRSSDLYKANLHKANLLGACLGWTTLAEADLSGANLYGADLSEANLHKANLSGANLYEANLSGVDLTDAILDGFDIPIVPNIDAAILDAIKAGGNLNMTVWHHDLYEATHHRAGWAVILAGESGAALEEKVGTSAAGALIYARSRPGGPVPDWGASNKEARADMRKWAAL